MISFQRQRWRGTVLKGVVVKLEKRWIKILTGQTASFLVLLVERDARLLQDFTGLVF